MGSSVARNAQESSIPRRGSYPKVECESTNVCGEYPWGSFDLQQSGAIVEQHR